jgi:hypothetical protein
MVIFYFLMKDDVHNFDEEVGMLHSEKFRFLINLDQI